MNLAKLMATRHSSRIPFNPKRPVSKKDLKLILEAARWSPTPHNMQNFEIVVVDDPKILKKIGGINSRVTLDFLRENYRQLSFSDWDTPSPAGVPQVSESGVPSRTSSTATGSGSGGLRGAARRGPLSSTGRQEADDENGR